MKNLFNSIKLQRPQNNVFDLTHDVKLSFNMGELIPICCLEAVPGDKFDISCESLLRFAPLVSPVMHRMDVTMHYFFVPNRILWDGWERFITGDTVSPAAPPFLNTASVDTAFGYPRLFDYLGIPPWPSGGGAGGGENISALPFAAFQAIYNEYYRDQNLIPEMDWHLNDGDNSSRNPLYDMRRRAWEHDYFTAALPFAQKGNPVTLPLGQFKDVDVKLNQGLDTTLTGSPSNVPVDAQISPDIIGSGLYAETSTLSAGQSTINDLRRAYRLQEFLEKMARGGSRLKEVIWSQFGVRTSDARLQRPEYITGIKSPVVISEVLNTSDTANAPQGNMAGHGISVTNGKYGKYNCEEHGFVMGIMSVMPKPAYQQGIHRKFSKFDYLDYFWPPFANIGEQEVSNKEVYAYTATADNTFGYVPRYAEYKFEQNRVAGDFRTSLDFWHLGRKFASQPSLNQAFIEVDSATTDRVFAVTDPSVQKMYCHVLNKIRAVRPMPVFGTPTF